MPDESSSGSSSSSGTSIKKQRDTFEWNGVNCSVFGIKMIQPPSFTLPKVRYKSVKIPGRSGNMVMMETDHTEVIVPNSSSSSSSSGSNSGTVSHGDSGESPGKDEQGEGPSYHQITTNDIQYAYDNILLSCTCIIKSTEMIREIASWLRGYGSVRFGNKWDVYYQARIANQIVFQKLVRGNDYYSFTVSFDCEPSFLFYMSASDIVVPNNGLDSEDDDGE